jgi:DNA polymerase-3 subunit beta
MGSLIKVTNGNLYLVATDSYRLSITQKTINNLGEFEIITPGSILEEVAKLSAGNQSVLISEAENQIIFETGSTTLISRKIEGQYPNYEILVPKEKTTSAVINTADLLTTIRRVSIASGTHGPVEMIFDPDKQRITVSSKTIDIASASESLDAQIEGEYLKIVFNHQYITDGLSVVDTNEDLFESQGSLKPGVLKTSADTDFLYLTMPVRVD